MNIKTDGYYSVWSNDKGRICYFSWDYDNLCKNYSFLGTQMKFGPIFKCTKKLAFFLHRAWKYHLVPRIVNECLALKRILVSSSDSSSLPFASSSHFLSNTTVNFFSFVWILPLAYSSRYFSSSSSLIF